MKINKNINKNVIQNNGPTPHGIQIHKNIKINNGNSIAAIMILHTIIILLTVICPLIPKLYPISAKIPNRTNPNPNAAGHTHHKFSALPALSTLIVLFNINVNQENANDCPTIKNDQTSQV